MAHLADRINRLSESQTIAMARRSRELIESGVDIISLSLGEPDFKTPAIIKNAAQEAIEKILLITHTSLATKSYVKLLQINFFVTIICATLQMKL